MGFLTLRKLIDPRSGGGDDAREVPAVAGVEVQVRELEKREIGDWRFPVNRAVLASALAGRGSDDVGMDFVALER